MTTKGVRSIIKTVLMFFLIITVVAPQTTWAVTSGSNESVIEGERALLQEKDLFNLTIKQEIIGVEEPTEVSFTFVVEFKDGEEYKPYIEQPYILFNDEKDVIGEAKVTDKDGKVTFKGMQRITIPKLTKGAKFKITEDISGEGFSYVVENKFNDKEIQKSHEIEEVIGGKDIIVFTNKYVNMTAVSMAGQVESPTGEGLPEVSLGATPEVSPEVTPEVTPEISVTPEPTGTPEDLEKFSLTKLKTGWTTSDGHEYYLDKNGKPVTGWQKIGNYRYYFKKVGEEGVKGRMLKGWNTISSKLYYFEPTGAVGVKGRMKEGWTTINKDTFYFEKTSGVLFAGGWKEIDNKWYYLEPSGTVGVKGRANTGWITSSGKNYYLETSGAAGVKGRMREGWATIGKDNFYFSKKGGHLLSPGWQKISNKWYYLEPSGTVGVKGRAVTGWKVVNGKTYYFKTKGNPGAKGRMLHGLAAIGSNSFFFGRAEDGSLKTGWQTLGKSKVYFNTVGGDGVKGRALTGWNKVSGKVYYFLQSSKVEERGKILTGWQLIGGQRYLLDSSGQPRVGWQQIGTKWYYLNPTGDPGVLGRLNTGWKTINGKVYFLKRVGNLGIRGTMFSGIKTIDNKKYYFGGSQDGAMKTGFQTISKAKYYFKKDGKADGTQGQMLLGWHTIDGSEYFFYKDTGKMATNVTIEGVYVGNDGKAVKSPQVQTGGSGQKTIKSLLKSAIQPVGSTLYIWGGGHDAWNSGGDGVRAGVNPNWKKFYNSQSSSYDYNSYRFDYGKGLDCSGFVSWATYNAIESKSNVMSTGSAASSTSTGMPAKYASNGWGKNNFTSAAKFTPGDVVSMSGHVWIVLGQCSDSSVVIIHSTPQAGVQIAGTPTSSGNMNSEAISLAKTYMKRYYNGIVTKFKLSSTVGRSYLTSINRFQWDVTGKRLMKDTEGYLKKTPAAILKDLYGE